VDESKKRWCRLQLEEAAVEVINAINQIERSHQEVKWRGADFDQFNARFYELIQPNALEAARMIRDAADRM
jgi:transposase-like protein